MHECGGYVRVTDPKWYVDFNDDPVASVSVQDITSGVVKPRIDAPSEVYNAFIRINTGRVMVDNFVTFTGEGEMYAGWAMPGMTLGSLFWLFAGLVFVIVVCTTWSIWG